MISDKDCPTPQEPLVLSLSEESSEINLDRYEGPPTLLLSSVLGQIPTSEEYVCPTGNVTLDFPLPLAIIPADQSSVDCGAHLIDKAEGIRPLPAIETLENSPLIRYPSKNPKESVGPSSVKPREKRLEMVPSRKDSCNPDCWDKNKFEEFDRFLGFSTTSMEKEILKFFQSLRSDKGKTLIKESSEKTRSERELKRLQFSINYKRGNNYGAKAPCVGGKREVYQ